MRGREISFWRDEREYEALQNVLAQKGLTVEAAMTAAFAEMYQQEVSEADRQAILDEIRTEELAEEQRWEAAKRFAAFHITEGGQEHWLVQERPTEFLDAAIILRWYLTDEMTRSKGSLAAAMRDSESITPNQFNGLILERMENTGRIVGAYDIDFDSGRFATLNETGCWETYPLKDISVAVYRAVRNQRNTHSRRWELFLNHLDGREVDVASRPLVVEGSRRIRPDDISFAESIEKVEGCLNFYMPCWFPVDKVFGTHVETAANDSYLNVYANYDLETGEVQTELDITLCRADGADIPLVYRLDEQERTALLEKMRNYCQEQTGQSLMDYAESLRMEEAGPQMTM